MAPTVAGKKTAQAGDERLSLLPLLTAHVRGSAPQDAELAALAAWEKAAATPNAQASRSYEQSENLLDAEGF